MKKLLAYLLVLVLVVGVFAGCTNNTDVPANENEEEGNQEIEKTEVEKEEMVLTFNLGDDVRTLDPALNSALNAGNVILNMYEGLMRLDEKEKAIPGIAKDVKISDDGLKYTFYLRDAKWSDGKDVTAYDFEYAWKRALSPETASEYAFQLYYIKNGEKYHKGEIDAEEVGVKALDDKTFEVELENPTSYFLELTAFYTYFPVRKDIVEKDPEGWAINPETAISNGPFKLDEYSRGDKIVLVKNENYYDAERVKLDKINMVMLPDGATALTAYENDEVHILDDIPAQETARISAESDEYQIRPYLANYYYVINIHKEPMDDIRVRKALSLAIDRKAITTSILKGGQKPATGFVPPGLNDANGNDFRETAGDYYIDPNKAQIEEAKALLAEAGYPDGKGFPKIEFLYNTSEGHKAIAEAVQEMWKDNLGIDIELQNQEWAVFQNTLVEGNFTIGKANWFGDYVDPMTFLDLWTSDAGKNLAKWKNEEYDKLIEKAKKTTGEERYNAMYEAEKLLMEDVVVIPLYYYIDDLMVKDYVKGVKKSMLGYFYFDETYIEK